MFAFLIGEVEEKKEGILVLNVNGVGYELFVSNNTLSTVANIGETAKVLTYMAVREDGIMLFGFSTKEEKDIFLKLITVSGIGPKMAISILSGMSISNLITAVISGDVKLLSNIKGLGKKTAERICLELKDKISPLGVLTDDIMLAQNTSIDEDVIETACDTLIALGINKNEAYKLARMNFEVGDSAEAVIAKSLRGYKG
jgi:Holliday junction DNA helicase RuvA